MQGACTESSQVRSQRKTKVNYKGATFNTKVYFPSWSVSLHLGFSLMGTLCAREDWAKKSSSLEARTPHQCDDRSLCLFSIWEFQNISQSLLMGATQGKSSLYLTRGSHGPSLRLLYPSGDRDMELYRCQLEFQSDPLGSVCCSPATQKF